ncbi:hypothetical protein L2E82_44796 [Cichorium intybus]|uniref:Uncharacterized protein n=1 Tax=Cichorium intybus TaxID=13427 RepID=A0ACB8ZR83_CICIN|nr:hypothetical protein L2E82_44796 [Cichorium intybus]
MVVSSMLKGRSGISVSWEGIRIKEDSYVLAENCLRLLVKHRVLDEGLAYTDVCVDSKIVIEGVVVDADIEDEIQIRGGELSSSIVPVLTNPSFLAISSPIGCSLSLHHFLLNHGSFTTASVQSFTSSSISSSIVHDIISSLANSRRTR